MPPHRAEARALIPRDLDSFYEQVTLRLYLNGRLRQQDSAGHMSWGPIEILAEIFRRKDWVFRSHEGDVHLLDAAGKIPAGTVIFSGTPAGVIGRLNDALRGSLETPEVIVARVKKAYASIAARLDTARGREWRSVEDTTQIGRAHV